MKPAKSAKAGSGGSRKARVEHALRESLGRMIRDEVKDPRVRSATLLTVTKVELNVDLSVANVYVSVIGDDATADGVLAGLAKAAGFLRGPIGRELHLQHAPELRFHRDVGLDMSERLAQIVREDEARARAAGREVVSSVVPPRPTPATDTTEDGDGDGDDEETP